MAIIIIPKASSNQQNGKINIIYDKAFFVLLKIIIKKAIGSTIYETHIKKQLAKKKMLKMPIFINKEYFL